MLNVVSLLRLLCLFMEDHGSGLTGEFAINLVDHGVSEIVPVALALNLGFAVCIRSFNVGIVVIISQEFVNARFGLVLEHLFRQKEVGFGRLLLRQGICGL